MITGVPSESASRVWTLSDICFCPVLCMFIFYSKCPFSRTAWRESQIQCPKACRYKNTRPVQSLLFFLALGCGGRLIWIINYSNWRRVMSLVRDLFDTSHSLLIPRHPRHAGATPRDNLGIYHRTDGPWSGNVQSHARGRMGILQGPSNSAQLTSIACHWHFSGLSGHFAFERDIAEHVLSTGAVY